MVNAKEAKDENINLKLLRSYYKNQKGKRNRLTKNSRFDTWSHIAKQVAILFIYNHTMPVVIIQTSHRCEPKTTKKI
jgi:hypothetical protein